jgi:putative transposase
LAVEECNGATIVAGGGKAPEGESSIEGVDWDSDVRKDRGRKKGLNKNAGISTTAYARSVGVSRQSLYYEHKLPEKDWRLKQQIEEVLHEHPSYGHKRIAMHLKINKKRIIRVMKKFGIKPYRRRGKKFRKSKPQGQIFPNLLLSEFPKYPHHIWASDFTHIPFHGKTVYLATIIDLFTREVVGFSVLTSHSVQLVMAALMSAVNSHPPPMILHSDQGSEYTSKDNVSLAQNLGITLSMSRKASPWENGYQESFYDKFKIDLGDPNRFEILGELVAAICHTIHAYNFTRIHTALKMAPREYAMMYSLTHEHAPVA